jgi:hypothetical protein
VSIECQRINDCTQHYITVSAESAITVDSTEQFVLKFKFVAIIVHDCDHQSLVILPKSNVHNLYLQHYNTDFIVYYRNPNFITLCKTKVKLSRYRHTVDNGGRLHS